MIKRDFFISIISLSLGLFLLLKKDIKTSNSSPDASRSSDLTKSAKHVIPKKLYGMVVDSLNVIEEKILPNQNLSEILSLYNVSFEVVNQLVFKSRGIFDLRKIIPDRKYTVICSDSEKKNPRYFIYEPNEMEYVVCNLTDSVEISRHYRKVDTTVQSISGVIESSLFESMVQAGARPEFAYTLADVFKWQVDFYKVQKGDKFKVLFEEILVENKPVATGKIIGAIFTHNGEDFYAINFDQGNGIEYFDNNGKNLQKTFLKAPLKFSRISSKFSKRRFHPVSRRYKAHLGTDYAAPTGTPIHTVGDGVVLEARYTPANGNYVKVKHDKTYTTQYLHMSRIASGIRPGKRIRQGERLGFVGSTGLATGPHLCFRFWKDGSQVDALKVKVTPTEPVAEKFRNQFEKAKMEVLQKLDMIPYSEKEYLASFR